MRSERIRFSLPAAWSALTGAMFVFVLGLLALGQPALSRYYQNLSLASNLALMPAALAGVALLLWGPRPAGDGERALRRQGVSVADSGAVCGGAGGSAGGGALRLVQDGLGHRQCLHHSRGTGPRTGAHRSRLFSHVPQQRAPDHPASRAMWVAVRLGLAVPFVVLPYLDAVLLNLTAYFTVRCAQRITPSRWARGFAAGRLHSLDRPFALCALSLYRYVGGAVSRARALRLARGAAVRR